MNNQPKLPEGWEDEPGEPVTLRDFTEHYLAENPRITSKETGRRYITTLNTLRDFFGYDPSLDDLTPATYGAWVKHRRDTGRVSDGTVRGDAEKLMVLWKFAANRAGRTMPLVTLPKKTAKTPEAWVPEQVQKLERTARHVDWWVGTVAGNIYWPALIGVAVDTGERHGAIHQLEARDLDLDNRVVTFRRETRKGHAVDNRKELSKQTVKDLKALLLVRPERPFGQLKRGSLYGPMRRLLMEAGFRAGRNNMFHSFRRYHATQVAIAGGDVTSSLGHVDPTLARKSYVDPTQLPQVLPNRKAPSLLSRILGRAS